MKYIGRLIKKCQPILGWVTFWSIDLNVSPTFRSWGEVQLSQALTGRSEDLTLELGDRQSARAAMAAHNPIVAATDANT